MGRRVKGSEMKSTLDKVYEFIQKHPYTTSEAIHRELGIKKQYVKDITSRLKVHGKVRFREEGAKRGYLADSYVTRENKLFLASFVWNRRMRFPNTN